MTRVQRISTLSSRLHGVDGAKRHLSAIMLMASSFSREFLMGGAEYSTTAANGPVGASQGYVSLSEDSHLMCREGVLVLGHYCAPTALP